MNEESAEVLANILLGKVDDEDVDLEMMTTVCRAVINDVDLGEMIAILTKWMTPAISPPLGIIIAVLESSMSVVDGSSSLAEASKHLGAMSMVVAREIEALEHDASQSWLINGCD